MIFRTLRSLANISSMLFVMLVAACGTNDTQPVTKALGSSSSTTTKEDPASPAARLSEARSKQSADAYRAFIKEFPNAPETETARRELAAIYDQALADFIQRAPADRPQLIQFVIKLTDVLKKAGNNSMEIRYREKEVPDESLFTFNPSVKTREKILSSLRKGFAAFPSSMLDISEGQDVTGPEALRDIEKPTIYIEYRDQMNNMQFGARGQKDPVFGYDVTLNLSFRIPSVSDRFEFSVFGRTPRRFSSNSDDVYLEVVELAVDQFLHKIEGTFTNGTDNAAR